MFEVNFDEINYLLHEYGIAENANNYSELLRYHYEKNNPNSKEVRLINKAMFSDCLPVVIKFLNEKRFSRELIEEQSEFSEHLRCRGINVAQRYMSKGHFANTYQACGIQVTVTVEDFMPGEMKYLTPEITYKIGEMLASEHNISEADNCHVNNETIFNPMSTNALFAYDDFIKLRPQLNKEEADIFLQIVDHYTKRIKALQPLKKRNKYAVQGDLSDCNLFIDESGNTGMFDFNNCGDNYLLGDAIMQGIFVARLQNYTQPLTDEYSITLFKKFLLGYNSIRAFTDEDIFLIPHLYAIIDTFWNTQINYGGGCLKNLLKAGRKKEIDALLHKMLKQISKSIPIKMYLNVMCKM